MLDLFMQCLGWVGHILFAISAVPQSYLSFKQGHSKGISKGLLAMWFGGEGIAIIYGLYEQVPLPLMFNYVINFICLLIIIRYAMYPRGKKCHLENENLS